LANELENKLWASRARTLLLKEMAEEEEVVETEAPAAPPLSEPLMG
jgi:hypothetical protein